jgi:Rps23 Pro-64 3,4-dihydroxylase Tpa1-like proline 4-hydroxylase
MLRREYAEATPFPFIKIENFLDSQFASEVAASYPSFEDGTRQGRTFKSVNERRKLQITDARLFSAPVARLNEALAAPSFLADLSYVTGIPDLLADAELVGGGMHMTGPGGRLDVHVDFNFLENRRWHRRLNFLLYLNPVWEERWGGHLQLWDKNVREPRQTIVPVMNRCIIFETSEISFHGVTPISAAATFPRISFAGYYYTRRAPPDWDGSLHSTVFRARPDERLRAYILMPAEMMLRRLATGVGRIKQEVKRLVGAL